MATLPYYIREDDIYSRLMANQSRTPRSIGEYLPALIGGLFGRPTVDLNSPSNVLGGYDPGLYTRTQPRQSAGLSGLLGGVSSGAGDTATAPPSEWSQMTPTQQAAYYAANPTMAAITQALQKGFGFTAMGKLQNLMVPEFVRQQQMIARGIDPNGMAGLSAQERANVNQALASYLESSMNQAPTYDAEGFGAYGENVAPGGFESSMGFDAGGFGAYGENAAPGGFESSMGFDVGGFGGYGENSGGLDSQGASADTGLDGIGFAKGGKVTMSGLLVDETIPGPDDGYAALQAGEYVIKKSTTKKLGDKKLKALNEGRASIKMRKG